MVSWEHKTELVCSLTIIEETKVIVILIEDGVWEAEDKKLVSWLTELRVGIDYVCKYDQYLCP